MLDSKERHNEERLIYHFIKCVGFEFKINNCPANGRRRRRETHQPTIKTKICQVFFVHIFWSLYLYHLLQCFNFDGGSNRRKACCMELFRIEKIKFLGSYRHVQCFATFPSSFIYVLFTQLPFNFMSLLRNNKSKASFRNMVFLFAIFTILNVLSILGCTH